MPDGQPDNVMTWEYFPFAWRFLTEIHLQPHHKGPVIEALLISIVFSKLSVYSTIYAHSFPSLNFVVFIVSLVWFIHINHGHVIGTGALCCQWCDTEVYGDNHSITLLAWAISIHRLQRLHNWHLGMDKQFHPTLYWSCDYVSVIGLKLFRVSKKLSMCG